MVLHIGKILNFNTQGPRLESKRIRILLISFAQKYPELQLHNFFTSDRVLKFRRDAGHTVYRT